MWKMAWLERHTGLRVQRDPCGRHSDVVNADISICGKFNKKKGKSMNKHTNVKH
jgi:hypothetical protein